MFVGSFCSLHQQCLKALKGLCTPFCQACCFHDVQTSKVSEFELHLGVVQDQAALREEVAVLQLKAGQHKSRADAAEGSLAAALSEVEALARQVASKNASLHQLQQQVGRLNIQLQTAMHSSEDDASALNLHAGAPPQVSLVLLPLQKYCFHVFAVLWVKLCSGVCMLLCPC